MNDRPNVLVLTPWLPPRPTAREGNFVLHQVRALRDAGAQVSVLVMLPWVPPGLSRFVPEWKRGVDVTAYASENIDVRVQRYFSLPRYLLGAAALPIAARGIRKMLQRVVAEKQIEVIHAHTESAGYVAAESVKDGSVAVVTTIHGINPAPQVLDSARKRAQFEAALNGSEVVVIVGSPLRNYLREIAARKYETVHNGFSLPENIPSGSRIPRRSRRRVVAVGNLHPNKGHGYLLEALGQLNERGYKDIEVVIVGDGERRRSLEELARQLGIADRVHFTGYLDHAEALAEIKHSDLFCLPSWREALGIVYMEAMALGKVAIGCQGQGPADFIAHNQTGYLVPPQNPHAVADAIAHVFDAPQDAARVAAAGRDFVHQHLTWAGNAERMLQLYREAIEQKCAQRSSASCST